MLKTALQPRWIAVLLVALAFATGFVLLSQWQIERSIEQSTVVERDSETVKTLDDVARPQSGVTTAAAGQLVAVDAEYVAGDYRLLVGRLHDGTSGYWVTAHAVTENGRDLAVALGWAATEADAETAIASNPSGGELHGRYLATEPAGDDDLESGDRRAMAVATLLNEWQSTTGEVYGGFLVLGEAPAGLTTIDAPAPATEIELNWLNIFYAAEWVVFAGFAVYLWWRFVRDDWERQQQEAEEAAAAALVN
jgi:surfeit locus 1 family protein